MCATTSAGFRVQRVHHRLTVQWVTVGRLASASPVQGAYTLADDVKALIRQVYARRGSLKVRVFHCLVALQCIFYMHCRPIFDNYCIHQCLLWSCWSVLDFVGSLTVRDFELLCNLFGYCDREEACARKLSCWGCPLNGEESKSECQIMPQSNHFFSKQVGVSLFFVCIR